MIDFFDKLKFLIVILMSDLTCGNIYILMKAVYDHLFF